MKTSAPEAGKFHPECVTKGTGMATYEQFLARKALTVVPTGIEDPPNLDACDLFPFQRDIVRWALRRGRAAIFADTGLGKSRMQIEWSRVVSDRERGPVLILAPLAVAAQTVREGERIGVGVTLCRDGADARDGINVTNYDRLRRFDPAKFAAVVLDESSCLKDFNSATRNELIESFRATPFRLACTATPSPNDFTELGNHAEFLGVMTRAEMLAMYFVHDGGSTQDWRIKGHAVDPFWRWVCSWAALIKKPSDLGYDDGAYALPELRMHEHVCPTDVAEAHASGMLFVGEAQTLEEQRRARRASLPKRVAECAGVVATAPKKQWLVWCELNDESDALTEAIPGAIQIKGSDSPEDKEQVLLDFAEGRLRVLVTKPSIAGWGLNFQRCSNMAFVGLSHSFEQFYQAVRRCWRFGQTKPVDCHVITSEADGAVVANLKRKQSDAEVMAVEMSKHTAAVVRESVRGLVRDSAAYRPEKQMHIPSWLRTEEAA